MATLKSRRGRKSQRGWARYNAQPGVFERRSAAREAAAIAGPAPVYPASAPLHGDWLGACINGHTVVLRLVRDRGHRSDQWAAELDGVVVAQAAGLVMLCQTLRRFLPKATSKRTMVGMQVCHLPQDEDDAALSTP